MVQIKQIADTVVPHTHDCACKQFDFTEGEQLYLRKIGLSKHAAELYSMLLAIGPLTAQGAASHRPRFASAQYRLFYELERHKLVHRLSGRPRRFQALALQIGLQSSLQGTERQLEGLLAASLRGQSAENLEIIQGRQALYEAYVRLTAGACDEICVYAIGIAYSDELVSTQRALRKRGVRVRHIVQQQKLSNLHVIAAWQRLGVKLRHLSVPRGFHFFVIDDSYVCITFSDPQDTDDRLSILTDNPAAVRLFKAQFDAIWQQAKPLAL